MQQTNCFSNLFYIHLYYRLGICLSIFSFRLELHLLSSILFFKSDTNFYHRFSREASYLECLLNTSIILIGRTTWFRHGLYVRLTQKIFGRTNKIKIVRKKTRLPLIVALAVQLSIIARELLKISVRLHSNKSASTFTPTCTLLIFMFPSAKKGQT